jgi:hypothetical protein
MLQEHTQLQLEGLKHRVKQLNFSSYVVVEEEISTDIQNGKKILFFNLKDFLQLN